MALSCLNSINLANDGTFTGFTSDGNFVSSTKTIFEVIQSVGLALKAPWMSDKEAFEHRSPTKKYN